MREKIVGAKSEVCIVVLAERKKKSTITRCELVKQNLADA